MGEERGTEDDPPVVPKRSRGAANPRSRRRWSLRGRSGSVPIDGLLTGRASRKVTDAAHDDPQGRARSTNARRRKNPAEPSPQRSFPHSARMGRRASHSRCGHQSWRDATPHTARPNSGFCASGPTSQRSPLRKLRESVEVQRSPKTETMFRSTHRLNGMTTHQRVSRSDQPSPSAKTQHRWTLTEASALSALWEWRKQ